MFDGDTALKKLKNVRLWGIIVVVSVLVWVFGFYWLSRPSSEQVFQVWVGADFELADGIKEEINDTCESYGMAECNINSYSPSDSQYAAAFALQSRDVDIYVLQKDEAISEAEASIFRELTQDFLGGDDRLEIDGVQCGIPFTGEYYVFINIRSDKSDELLKAVVDIFSAYGG